MKKRKSIRLVFLVVAFTIVFVLTSFAQNYFAQQTSGGAQTGAIRFSRNTDTVPDGIPRGTSALYNSATRILEVKGTLLPNDYIAPDPANPSAPFGSESIQMFPDGTLHPAVPHTDYNDHLSTPIGVRTMVAIQEVSFVVTDASVSTRAGVNATNILGMGQEYTNFDGGFAINIPVNLDPGEYKLWVATLNAVDFESIVFTVS